MYTLVETIINATERLSFSDGRYPISNLGYLQEIVDKLKKHNGSNLSLKNLHKQILEDLLILYDHNEE